MNDLSSIEYLETIQEVMTDIKGNFFHFLLDREHFFDLAGMYHGASLMDAIAIADFTTYG